MTNFDTVTPYLFLVTLVLALAVGVWQLFRVRKARKEHHRSASARANHEPGVAASEHSSGLNDGRTTDSQKPQPKY